MKLYKNKSDCFGCSACQTSCAQKAISMKTDDEGFLYPFINTENCVDCGMCTDVCSKDIIFNESFLPKAYAFINRDRRMRRRSSSGGVFVLLAEAVLRHGGVVCGAIIESETLIVRHMVSNRWADIEKMMGSKYVQSDMRDCYALIEEHLCQGTLVLFSGTPCQTAGCYRAVGRHDNLITCDVLCHGTPSPMIWKDYASDLEAEYGEKIKAVSFRSKRQGWHNFGMEISFGNGRKYFKTLDQDAFLCGFLRDLYLRPICYTCKYSKKERISDITIGDFWGYNNHTTEIKDDDKGLSAIIVSTEKGMAMVDSITPFAQLQQVSIDSMIPGNGPLRGPVECPPVRDEFWKDYEANGYGYVKLKYMLASKYKGFDKFKRSALGRTLIKTRRIIKDVIS